MFTEKRKVGNGLKYYLVHSYREGSGVKKIRKYLGANLPPQELEKAKKIARAQMEKEIKSITTDVFNFSLTKKQKEKLNKYDEKIRIHHLEGWNWGRFTEQFTYSTNAIEGSTISPEEIPEILKSMSAKDPEEIETRGVAAAVDFIRKAKGDVSLGLIKKLHLICFRGSKQFAGEFRKLNVVIRDGSGNVMHEGVPVRQLGKALEELVSWYRHNKKSFRPLVLAAIMHNQFEHIHPFQDGNGRVGRLLLNFILISNGYPPVNILLEDRAEYYRSLREYSKNNDLKPTLKFLIKQYKKTLKQVTTKQKD